MPIINATNIYSNSRFIVGAANSPYTTIQSAINAANAAGGNATVWVRSGTYTENLTLYTTVDLEGADSALTIIVGTHTPPNAGSMSFTRIGLNSGTDVLNSAAAGTTTLTFSRCVFNLTNGYAANLTNWTGEIRFRYCIDNSTKNGIVYNTAGAAVLINHGIVGLGANVMTANGAVTMMSVACGCPILLNGTGTSLFTGACNFSGSVTTANTHTLTIALCRIDTGATTAITHNSANTLVLDSTIVRSSNATAIAGTGTIKEVNIQYPLSNVIAGTITQSLEGVTRTAEMWSDNIMRMFDTGFYSWAAVGPYFDVATLGTFKLLVGGTGYIKGKRITWVAQNYTGMTAGNVYYIYINNTGTIGAATAATDALYEDYIVLFQCLRDSTPVTNNQVTVKENHPYSFQVGPSNWMHDVAGTLIENNQNGANITLNGTQGIQINGADVLSDHGLETTIPDSGGAAVTWIRMYTTAAGKWARQNATTTFTGYWNNAGTPTALTGGRWAVYTLYVSKDTLNTTTPTYFAVLDIAQYGSSAAASTAIANGTTAKATNELAALELAQLGYIIYRESSATITTVTISKTTLRATLSTGGTNTASLITTDTTNFDAWLSAADTNVQAALETLDNLGKGNLLVQRAGAAADVTLTVSNTDNSAAASAAHTQITVGGSTSTGDPYTNYLVTGAGTFSVGIDNSDSDRFKVTSGTSTSAGEDLLTLSTSIVSIGNAAVAKTITVGNVTGATAVNVNSGTGACAWTTTNGTFGLVTGTGAINIGADAVAKTVTIGNNTGPTIVSIVGGTEGVELESTGAGPILLSALGNAIRLNGTTEVELNCDTGPISIGTDANAYAIDIGTGGAARTITVGNATGATSLVLNCGTGALNIGTNAIAHTVTIGNATGATSVVIDCGTGALNIGSNAIARTTTVGNTTGASVLALKCGTGDFTLASATGTIMNALDTGEVTFPLQPAFSAYLSSTVTNVTGDGTNYVIVFDTEKFDTGADYNNGTGIFTAPVTGRYVFMTGANVYDWAVNNTTAYIVLVATDGDYSAFSLNGYATRSATGNWVVSGVCYAAMAAGDTMRVRCDVYGTTKGIDIYGSANATVFSGFLNPY